MKIGIRIDDTVLTATLEDSATARDFASLLPLTVTLRDHASTEKIADLPRRLSEEDAPAGFDPSVRDIAYYAPWGNVAIYHRDFGYSRGLIHLGTIESGIEALSRPGPRTATIELLDR
ncbi:cyclophilin [Inquilinus limosus]